MYQRLIEVCRQVGISVTFIKPNLSEQAPRISGRGLFRRNPTDTVKYIIPPLSVCSSSAHCFLSGCFPLCFVLSSRCLPYIYLYSPWSLWSASAFKPFFNDCLLCILKVWPIAMKSFKFKCSPSSELLQDGSAHHRDLNTSISVTSTYTRAQSRTHIYGVF